MNTIPEMQNTGLTRRDFLKTAGLTTAAFLLPNMLSSCGITPNTGAVSMASVGSKMAITDVLVIGGGMAGTFAAITAKAQGLNVTLVDKGTVGRSGSTPWANGISVFDEAQGDNRDEWIAGISTSSDYVNNLDWLDLNLNDSKDRWNDIVEFPAPTLDPVTGIEGG